MKHGHWGCPQCGSTVVFRQFNVPARQLVKLEVFEDEEENPDLHVIPITKLEVMEDQKNTRKEYRCPSCDYVFTAAKWWRDK